MKPSDLRAIAICVIRHEDSIFVLEGRDEVIQETFYRPLGGAIEFGEYSIDTIQRELSEEIREEICNIRYLSMLENVFRFEGEMGHEIVLIYETDFVDPLIYDKSWVTGYEDDGKPFKALWMTIEHFRNSKAPLYPDGLLQLLVRH